MENVYFSMTLTFEDEAREKPEAKNFLELDHLSLPLLVTAELEVLGALDRGLESVLAGAALQTEDQLLGGLGLGKTEEGKLSVNVGRTRQL